MPSPVGHALAGIAVSWAGDLVSGRRIVPAESLAGGWFSRAGGSLTVLAAALAAAPDLDLIVGVHRTATHSLTAVLFVMVMAALVAAWLKLPVGRVALLCGAAWGSHLLLDWMAMDVSAPRGIQMLWPFSRTWFVSGWDVFASTERRRIFSARSMEQNVWALTREVLVLAPVLLALWSVRVKALTRLSTQPASRHHPAQ